MRKLILLSGGLDSLVLLGKTLLNGDEAECLFVDYGQTHKRMEHVSAKNICDYYKVVLNKICVCGLQSNVDNSDPYVWGRNSIFLLYASAYAIKNNFDVVCIGANNSDEIGFPDCREGFFEKFGCLVDFLGGPKIEAPFLHLTKTEIVSIGVIINVPFEISYTCYLGGEKSCGKCGSCKVRLEAFINNGMDDFLAYV